MIQLERRWLGLPPDATDEQIQDRIRTLGETNRALQKELLRAKGDERSRQLSDRVRAASALHDDGAASRVFVEDQVRKMFETERRADPSLHEGANAAQWHRDYWRTHPEQFLLMQRQRSERVALLREHEVSEAARLLAEHVEHERAAHPARARFQRLLAEARASGLSVQQAYTQVCREHREAFDAMQAEKR